MKELAAVTVHWAIHLLNLWLMGQESNKPRVTATADMCCMDVKCNCVLYVLYRDEVVHQVVIHGMRDQEIRTRVLSRNTSSDLTTLAKLVDYIAAEEDGLSESH